MKHSITPSQYTLQFKVNLVGCTHTTYGVYKALCSQQNLPLPTLYYNLVFLRDPAGPSAAKGSEFGSEQKK